MRFSDLSLIKKIYLLLTLPVLGFLWLSINSIVDSVRTTQEISTITRLTKLSVVYSEVVHELQTERGATAGFIGSKGVNFSNKLASQRRETEAKLQQTSNYMAENTFTLSEVSQLNSTVSQMLQKLPDIRRQVDNLSISLSDALEFYTRLTTQLLSIATLNADISHDAAITENTIAYYNFLQGKERAGIERAVLSNTFSADIFAKGMFVKFIALVTQQDTYFDNFNQFASKDNKNFLLEP